ncbi:lasso peptide biosynthesis B2 protein [Steroidobacter cummioxidans]|uniref:lasso peptide biosynthesis B2 protein n=1 Tax=Steroidobacter cummioxidans TaxID=1803913 RepID=UPI0032E4A9C2
MVEFLARYDVFPTWVFGVRLEPWGAHCWIQHGPFTFNEGVEKAASYTPIMAV